MPHSIPKGLTQVHILKALADLDAGIEHSFGEPIPRYSGDVADPRGGVRWIISEKAHYYHNIPKSPTVVNLSLLSSCSN